MSDFLISLVPKSSARSPLEVLTILHGARQPQGESFTFPWGGLAVWHEPLVRGRNIVPGGQSSRPGDPHFADQAHLWLANETLPLRYTVAEVVAGALSREELRPAP